MENFNNEIIVTQIPKYSTKKLSANLIVKTKIPNNHAN